MQITKRFERRKVLMNSKDWHRKKGNLATASQYPIETKAYFQFIYVEVDSLSVSLKLIFGCVLIIQHFKCMKSHKKKEGNESFKSFSTRRIAQYCFRLSHFLNSEFRGNFFSSVSLVNDLPLLLPVLCQVEDNNWRQSR